MENRTRTQAAAKNAVLSGSCQIIYILVSFVCRTIFTKLFGTEYLGINGLFTNILTILSFLEMGVGSALVYKMYLPLHKGDKKKTCAYLHYYKKAYNVIAVLVASIGIAFIPFLKYLVDAPNVKENIVVLYVLFLADTVLSYICVYKKSILIADQKSYVISIYTQLCNIVMNILQICFLLMTLNFILYLVIKIVCNLSNNIICTKKAEKLYPYIKSTTDEKLSKKEELEIKRDVKGLLLGKIASISFGGTDDIFITKYVGISFTGIIANYSLLITTVNTLMNRVFDSITASVGNLGVNETKEKVEEVFLKIYFINAILYGYICVGMLLLLKDFVIEIWLDKSFFIADISVYLIILELYLRGLGTPVNTTRNAMGLFSQLKMWVVFSAVMNIILDFFLVQIWGIAGVFSATIISRIMTRYIDNYVLYHYKFKKTVWNFYRIHLRYVIIMLVCWGILYCLFRLIVLPVIPAFLLKFLIITLVYFGIVILCFNKTKEYLYFKALILKLVQK